MREMVVLECYRYSVEAGMHLIRQIECLPREVDSGYVRRRSILWWKWLHSSIQLKSSTMYVSPTTNRIAKYRRMKDRINPNTHRMDNIFRKGR